MIPNVAIKQKLYTWLKLIINARDGKGQWAETAEMGQSLKEQVEEARDVHLTMLHQIFTVACYRGTGDHDAANELLRAVGGKRGAFTPEIALYYYIQQGIAERDAENYYEALAAFRQAEENSWEKPDMSLYHNIAICYTFTDNPLRSMAYLVKARETATEAEAAAYDISFDMICALNYTRMNKHEKALDLLFDCLARAKGQRNSKEQNGKEQSNKAQNGTIMVIGDIYHNIGFVYFNMARHLKAIHYFDLADKAYAERNAAYIRNQFYKGRALHAIDGLIAVSSCTEHNEPLDKCLDAPIKTELMTLMLQAQLDFEDFEKDPDTLARLKDEFIPALAEKGQLLLAIQYCEEISASMAKNEKYKMAWPLKCQANVYREKLLEGGYAFNQAQCMGGYMHIRQDIIRR